MPIDAVNTKLLQILALLYRQDETDRVAIESKLLEQCKQSWRSAIQAEARRFGYIGPVSGPNYIDLAFAKAECQLDSTSIVRTWNRDVERQLVRLFNENPRGNRYYYIKNMEAWARQRATWKDPQISIKTEYTIVGYAKDRFYQENGMRGGLYKLVGPPPVCDECIDHMAMGVVGQEYVDRNPAPFHLKCTHTWQQIKGSVAYPPPNELWVGG